MILSPFKAQQEYYTHGITYVISSLSSEKYSMADLILCIQCTKQIPWYKHNIYNMERLTTEYSEEDWGNG